MSDFSDVGVLVPSFFPYDGSVRGALISYECLGEVSIVEAIVPSVGFCEVPTGTC